MVRDDRAGRRSGARLVPMGGAGRQLQVYTGEPGLLDRESEILAGAAVLQ